MTHTITFEDEDENREVFLHAMGFYLTVWDVLKHIHQRIKYGEVSEEVEQELAAVRGIITNSIDARHLPELL